MIVSRNLHTILDTYWLGGQTGLAVLRSYLTQRGYGAVYDAGHRGWIVLRPDGQQDGRAFDEEAQALEEAGREAILAGVV